MPTCRLPITSLAAFLLSTLPCPSFASDGVVEINQTCAITTGCFAGDASGFPVTIQATPTGPAGGSYLIEKSCPWLVPER